MEGVIQEVKNKIDIVDLVGSYIPLKKAGRNYRANCPFHNENSPSFVVSPDRQIWHCFGACGDGGDCIKFVMKLENITFYEALKELAVKAGVSIKSVAFEDKEWQKKEKIFQINALTAEFFQYILHKTSFGKEALEYLTTRGITEPIAKTFQLGYAPSSWDSLIKFLSKKGFSSEDMVKSGVVVKNDNNRLYDRFRGRLIFPIKDIRGNILGFSGRILDKKEGEAKYINSPETDVYHKRESLYGINLAKDAIKKENSVLLVEGEFDMISPYQFSIENVVAVKGSALTKEQLIILKRLTTKIIFAFDADKAGTEAIKKAIKEAEELDFDLYVFDWGSEAKDPDELVRNNLIEFKNKLKAPISIYDFIIKSAVKKYQGETAFDKKKIGEEVGPFISTIKNPIIQSHYIKKVATLLEVSEDSVQVLLKNFQQKNLKPLPYLPKAVTKPKHNREEVLEKYLLSYMFQNEKIYTIAEVLARVLSPEDFSIGSYNMIFKAFLEYRLHHPTENVKEFCDSLSPELQSVCNELFLYNIETLQELAPKSGDDLIHIEKTALHLKKESLKKALNEITSKSSDTDDSREQELLNLMVALKEVEKKMSSLYNY